LLRVQRLAIIAATLQAELALVSKLHSVLLIGTVLAENWRHDLLLNRLLLVALDEATEDCPLPRVGISAVVRVAPIFFLLRAARPIFLLVAEQEVRVILDGLTARRMAVNAIVGAHNGSLEL